MIFVKAKPVLLFIRGHSTSVCYTVYKRKNEEEMHYVTIILRLFLNIMLIFVTFIYDASFSYEESTFFLYRIHILMKAA